MNYDGHLSDTENLADNVNVSIKRYENHSSIAKVSCLLFSA